MRRCHGSGPERRGPSADGTPAVCPMKGTVVENTRGNAENTGPGRVAGPGGAQLLAGQMAPADGVALWKQLRSAGFRAKAAFLAQASDADSWWQSLGRGAQGTLSEGYWSPGQASPGQLAAIAPTLGQKYAGSPGYATAAVGYAVAEVLTGALAKAGAATPGKLNIAIAQADAPTTAGLIRFNASTHTAVTPYYVTQWQNGKLVQVQPPAPGVTLGVPTAGLG